MLPNVGIPIYLFDFYLLYMQNIYSFFFFNKNGFQSQSFNWLNTVRRDFRNSQYIKEYDNYYMHAHCPLCESITFEGKGFRATLLIIFKRTY